MPWIKERTGLRVIRGDCYLCSLVAAIVRLGLVTASQTVERAAIGKGCSTLLYSALLYSTLLCFALLAGWMAGWMAGWLAGWLLQGKSSWFPRGSNPGQLWRGLRLPWERRIRRRTPSGSDTLPGAPGILRDNFGATILPLGEEYFSFQWSIDPLGFRLLLLLLLFGFLFWFKRLIGCIINWCLVYCPMASFYYSFRPAVVQRLVVLVEIRQIRWKKPGGLERLIYMGDCDICTSRTAVFI